MADCFCHTEVRDHGVMAGEQHIVGLDVAVYDATGMRVRERVRHVLQDAHGVAHRQLALASQFCPEGFALDERHRVEEDLVRSAGGEQWHDVRVLQ